MSDIKAGIKKARSKPCHFAFTRGPGDKDILLIHDKRPIDALAREAKAAGKGAVSSGIMNVEGSQLFLDTDTVVPNMETLLRKLLKAEGLTVKPVIRPAGAAPVEADKAEAETPAPEAEKAEGDPRALRAARQSWGETRKSVAEDVKRLIIAITKETKGVEGLETAASDARKLTQHIAPIDGRMAQMLARMEQSSDDCAKLMPAARKLLKDHATLMNSEFFKAVDENGFANTRIRASVMSALDHVDKALQAQN